MRLDQRRFLYESYHQRRSDIARLILTFIEPFVAVLVICFTNIGSRLGLGFDFGFDRACNALPSAVRLVNVARSDRRIYDIFAGVRLTVHPAMPICTGPGLGVQRGRGARRRE